MAQVISSQRWGVPAGAPHSATVHVKNGWLPRATHGWRINSIGGFTWPGRWYSIVVLSPTTRAWSTGSPPSSPSLASYIATSTRMSRTWFHRPRATRAGASPTRPSRRREIGDTTRGVHSPGSGSDGRTTARSNRSGADEMSSPRQEGRMRTQPESETLGARTQGRPLRRGSSQERPVRLIAREQFVRERGGTRRDGVPEPRESGPIRWPRAATLPKSPPTARRRGPRNRGSVPSIVAGNVDLRWRTRRDSNSQPSDP